MTDILFRPQAEADIVGLSEFAERFPVHERTGFGLRRMRSGHHSVFNLVTEKHVKVVRILHERNDPDQEL